MGAATVLMVSGLIVVAGSAATASPTAAVASVVPCNETISTAPGTVMATASGALVVGVTAGTTKILIDCNATSTAAFAIESSLLGGIQTSTVTASNEADLATLVTFVASSTDTGCPAAAAGSCTLTTFTVPATYTAADPASACPPTQAQINAGLFGCAIAVVNAASAPVAGGEFLVMYASQTNLPNEPTISASPKTGAAGSSITVNDAPGNTKYWWGNTIQAVQAATLGTTPTAPPTTCGTGGGYGNVPSAFLAVMWFATGSVTPIVGSAAGVTISNDCYDGTTLQVPALSGTITAPSTLVSGTNYTAYLCELNATPYPSNDASATANCGAAPAGTSWIDASFTFSAVSIPGTITQIAPTSGSVTASGSAAFTAQLAVTGNNGTVTYNQHAQGPDLSVSASGNVSTNHTLAAGTYTATGTTSDPNSDNGTFTYTLTVGAITQSAPTSGSTTTTSSKTFTQQLAVTGNNGTVIYTKTGGSANLTVTGGLVATTGALAAGTYTATGTTSDPNGDLGTFTYTLTVTAVKPPVVLRATHVYGVARVGRTVTLTISGTGFYGKPRITSNEVGTRVVVSHDTGKLLTVRVTVRAGSRTGSHTFTIRLANGKSCKVNYLVR
jgi:hypothetical protein